jgi:hypothetical protein
LVTPRSASNKAVALAFIGPLRSACRVSWPGATLSFSATVGVREALTRLENLGLGIADDEKKTIENIQRVRNRIEHHRYDLDTKQDEAIIAVSLKFILYFVEMILERKLEEHIEGALLRDINSRVLEYNERQGLVEFRFREWAHKQWPGWNEEEEGRRHVVERRTREFCASNIFKRPRLPRATCS